MKRKQSKESNTLVAGIMDFLSDHGKTDLLPSLTEVLDDELVKTKHADHIEVISAVPLTKQELQDVRGIVIKFTKNSLPIENSINQKILGGFAIRIGDFFLDASLQGEIKNIMKLLRS